MVKLFLLVALSAFQTLAHADPISLNIEVGYPVLNVSLPPNLSPGLGSYSFFGLEVMKNIKSYPLGMALFNRAFLGGKFATLPVMQTGFSLYVYPFTLPESGYAEDEGVMVVSSSTIFYGKFQGGIQFLNFRNAADGAVFGASSPLFSVGGGAALPLTTFTRMGLEASYMSSVGATDPNGGFLSVSGFLFSLRYSILFP